MSYRVKTARCHIKAVQLAHQAGHKNNRNVFYSLKLLEKFLWLLYFHCRGNNGEPGTAFFKGMDHFFKGVGLYCGICIKADK